MIISTILLFITQALGQSITKSEKYNLCSQLEYNYFNVKADRYFAECYSGLRESYFEYDGVPTQKVEYGIFRVVLDIPSNYAKVLYANIKINDLCFDIIMEKNPFDDSYMSDCCKIFASDDNIGIMIENIDYNHNDFSHVSDTWLIDYKEAIDIAFKTLDGFIKENKSICEGYLTIIYNKNNNDTLYFWSYRIVTKNNKSVLVVIDVYNGDVVLISWLKKIFLI